MSAEPHGNSKKSDKPHHLYEIRDSKRNDVFKFGISGEPLNSDGSSPRAKAQVQLFNALVGWARFFARVLMTNIPGRRKARDLEDQFIDEYERKYGERPRGNR